MKGKAPAISKRIRRIFELNFIYKINKILGKYKYFLIDEFRTSKLCNRCENILKNIHHSREKVYNPELSTKRNPLKKPINMRYIIKNNKRVKSDKLIWGLLTCSNKCGLTHKGNQMDYKHNRDKNACLNMEKIIEHLRLNNKRPLNYTRNNGTLSSFI